MAMSFFLADSVNYNGKTGLGKFADNCFSPFGVLLDGRRYTVCKHSAVADKSVKECAYKRDWKEIAIALAVMIPAFILSIIPKIISYNSSIEKENRAFVQEWRRKNAHQRQEEWNKGRNPPRPPTPPQPPKGPDPKTRAEKANYVLAYLEKHEQQIDKIKEALISRGFVRPLYDLGASFIQAPETNAKGLAILAQALKGVPSMNGIAIVNQPITCDKQGQRDLSGIQAFAQALPTRLDSLCLTGTGLDDEAIEILAKGLEKYKTKNSRFQLDLSSNPFGLKGLQALRDALKECPVSELILSGIPLNEEACKVVAEILQEGGTPLMLFLNNCEIDDAGVRHFAQALQRNEEFQKNALHHEGWLLLMTNNDFSATSGKALYDAAVPAQNRLILSMTSPKIPREIDDDLKTNYQQAREPQLKPQ